MANTEKLPAHIPPVENCRIVEFSRGSKRFKAIVRENGEIFDFLSDGDVTLADVPLFVSNLCHWKMRDC